MKVQAINIGLIKTKSNIRTKLDVGQLMESIKQHGLLHPIAVWKENQHYVVAYGNRRLEACKKLDWKEISAVILPKKLDEAEFLSMNTIENIHRKNVTAAELTKVCGELKNPKEGKGLSVGEIAVRFNLPRSKVHKYCSIYKNLPEKYKKYIGFQKGKDRKGRIPPDVLNAIVNMRTSTKVKNQVLNVVQKEEFTLRQIKLIEKFILSGATVKEAVGLLDRYVIKNSYLVVDKRELRKIDLPFAIYVAQIVKKYHPGLVYLKEVE